MLLLLLCFDFVVVLLSHELHSTTMYQPLAFPLAALLSPFAASDRCPLVGPPAATSKSPVSPLRVCCSIWVSLMLFFIEC